MSDAAAAERQRATASGVSFGQMADWLRRPDLWMAAGVIGIRLARQGDAVVGMSVVEPESDILVLSETGYGKRVPLWLNSTQAYWETTAITVQCGSSYWNTWTLYEGQDNFWTDRSAGDQTAYAPFTNGQVTVALP